MPTSTASPSTTASSQRRLRPAASRVHGGASSMLRLGRGGDARLPTGAALSGWAERAAAMLDLTPMMVGMPTHAVSGAPLFSTAPLPAAHSLAEVRT
jgi:hypothetical protein